MLKRISFIWMAILLTVASTTPSAQDVRYNFDKDSDFSKFKTYEWVVLKGATPVDDLTDKQIKEAVDAQLAAKGLSKVEGSRRQSSCRLSSGGWQLKSNSHLTIPAGDMGRDGTEAVGMVAEAG